MNNNVQDNNSNPQDLEQNAYYDNNSYYANNSSYNNYSDSSYEEKKNKGFFWKILVVILILLIIILLLLKFCTGNGSKSAEVRYTELTDRLCKAAQTYAGNNPTVMGSGAVGSSAIIKFRTLADANLIEAKIKNPYYDGGLFKKGSQEQYYSMDNSVRLIVQGDGTYRCEIVDNAKDVTAPELRLNGDSEITLPVGTEFEDPGYTATDDYDGDLTDKVVRSGNVDPRTKGTYTLTYTVQDSAGNVTSKTRTIIYEEYANIEITLGSILDGVTPMISLKGANPYCMVKGTQYVEPGATATDNVDGNITDRIVVTNKVSGNLMGAFRVVYKVEDSSGNQAIAYRAVIVTTSCPDEVKEPAKAINNAPRITLIGKNSVTINRGTEYIDLGATAYDKEDGDITSKIVTDTSNVNPNSAGIYKVIYRVTDSGGLTSTATRTVTVKNPVSGNPSLRWTEKKKNIEVEVGKGDNSLLGLPKAVNENGVQVNVTSRIEDYVTKKAVSAINWNQVGKYRVTYTAIHGNGVLKQTKTIVVTIIEGEVTIGGKNPIDVILRTDNCDLNEADLIKGGVTFNGNGLTPVVTITKNEGIACKKGTYQVDVTAKVGDQIATKTITVNVIDGTPEPVAKDAPGKVVVTDNTATPSDVYNKAGKWVGGAVTGIQIRFEAVIPAGTTLAHFELSKDCSTVYTKTPATSANSGTYYWTEEGKNAVCIRAVNTAGNAGPWSDPVNLYLDRTGPKVEFTHTWKDDKDDWHNTETLTVTYKATDNASGLDHFEYTYDDVKGKKAEEIVTYNEATGKLVVRENTEPTRPSLFVFVRAVDKVGNKGEWTLKPAYANIDTVKPNAPTTTVTGNNTAVVTINATAIDNTSIRPSGIGRFVYTLNNGEEMSQSAIKGTEALSGNAAIVMPSNNTTATVNYDVRVWSVDKAGNRSDGYSNNTVSVAKATTPVTGVQIKNDKGNVANGAACSSSAVNPQTTFKLTAEPIPSNADIKTVTWSSSNTNVVTIDKDGNVKANKVGTVTITAKISDSTATCTIKVTTDSCKEGEYSKDGVCTKCPAGSYCSGGTAQPIPCATGSYSGEGASSCTACQNGTTTSGTGQTSCNAKCSNSEKTWKKATWTPNKVTNLCTGESTPTPSPTPSPSPITCRVDNCTSCSSNDYCSKCKDGYKVSNGKCVEDKQSCYCGVCSNGSWNVTNVGTMTQATCKAATGMCRGTLSWGSSPSRPSTCGSGACPNSHPYGSYAKAQSASAGVCGSAGYNPPTNYNGNNNCWRVNCQEKPCYCGTCDSNKKWNVSSLGNMTQKQCSSKACSGTRQWGTKPSVPSSCSNNYKTCAAGTYLTSGGCIRCTANYYCPGGTFNLSGANTQGIYACPSGKTSIAGSSSQSQCVAKDTSKVGQSCGTNKVYSSTGSCVCASGYAGSNCVKVGASCGTNKVYNSSGVCACASGYVGSNCVKPGASCGTNKVYNNSGVCVCNKTKTVYTETGSCRCWADILHTKAGGSGKCKVSSSGAVSCGGCGIYGVSYNGCGKTSKVVDAC